MKSFLDIEALNYMPSGTELSDLERFLPQDEYEQDPVRLRRFEMLNLLLEAVEPTRSGVGGHLNGLWVREAHHRAQTLLYLMLLLDKRHRQPNLRYLTASQELNLARQLSRAYRSLYLVRSSSLAECNLVLRKTLLCLASLFGPATGVRPLDLSLPVVLMPPDRARALILIANGLLIQTLIFSEKQKAESHFSLAVERLSQGVSRLVVTADFNLDWYLGLHGYEIFCALAGALDGELSFANRPSKGTKFEIMFPARIVQTSGPALAQKLPPREDCTFEYRL